MEKRENWIDVLKGVGIIFVIIGHVSLSSEFSRWIYTFHMPLFFILSGFLWSRSSERITIKEFCVKRIKSILWPYVFFRILLIIYWCIVESHFRHLDIGPIWFLIVLFFAEITAFLFLNTKRSILKSMSIVMGAILVLYIFRICNIDNNNIGAWLMRCMDGFMWYTVGHLVGIMDIESKISNKRVLKIVLMLVLLCISLIISRINGNVSIWSNSFGNYIWFIIGGVVGTLFIACVCKEVLSKNKLLEYYGRNTITILATHEPIKRVILKIIEVISSKVNLNITIAIVQSNFGLSMIVVIIILFIEILVIWIFNLVKKQLPKNMQRNVFAFIRE